MTIVNQTSVFYNCYVCNVPGRLLECEDCNEFVCNECSSLYGKIPEHLKGLRELAIIYCVKCEEKLEAKIIEELEEKDLPLHVNTDWITKTGEDLFKEKFKRGFS